MTELQQYLAEEVAEDHADGIITRREAVRTAGSTSASSSSSPRPARASSVPSGAITQLAPQ